MNDYQLKAKPFFVLAPMDDVTDTVFRQVVAKTATPDLFFTEFVNVDGLQSVGAPALRKRVMFTAAEKPLILQIWGKNPENYYKTALQMKDAGYAGIDINMGCPVKKVVSSSCSGLINNRTLAVEIIKATQQGAGGLPVSVKTRLGFNEIDYSWHELLLEQNLNMLSVHGRTRKEMSKVPAHWDAIGRIRQMRDDAKLNTLIVGNGDVENRQHGLDLATKYSLDGIMVGRGIFTDPFVFAEHSTWQGYSADARIELYRQHVQLFADTWPDGERNIHTLNKFCKVYIQGFEGAKELREKLMAANSTAELLYILNKYL